MRSGRRERRLRRASRQRGELAPLCQSTQTAEGWSEAARALRAQRRVGEALCAFARAAAVTKDRATFVRHLDEARPPLVPEHATALAAQVIKVAEGNITLLVDALLRGGDAGLLLRSIASSCPGTSRASLDFVDAAIVLAPEREHCYVTRTLINLSLGDPESALADTNRLTDDFGEQREFLQTYRRVLFPTFDFGRLVRVSIRCSPICRKSRANRFRRCAKPSRSARRDCKWCAGYCGASARDACLATARLSALLPRGPATLERRVFEIAFDEEEIAANGNQRDAESVERVEVDETRRLVGARRRIAHASCEGRLECAHLAMLERRPRPRGLAR